MCIFLSFFGSGLCSTLSRSCFFFPSLLFFVSLSPQPVRIGKKAAILNNNPLEMVWRGDVMDTFLLPTSRLRYRDAPLLWKPNGTANLSSSFFCACVCSYLCFFFFLYSSSVGKLIVNQHPPPLLQPLTQLTKSQYTSIWYGNPIRAFRSKINWNRCRRVAWRASKRTVLLLPIVSHVSACYGGYDLYNDVRFRRRFEFSGHPRLRSRRHFAISRLLNGWGTASHGRFEPGVLAVREESHNSV